MVCRELGIHYLWIDTLCIVQDSQEDWERQSSVMGTIYHESTLTIAALAAFDSSERLVIPNEMRDFVRLPWSFGNYRGQAYVCPSSWTYFFHSFNIHRSHPDTVVRNALSKRGWAYQEQVLARRTLKFMHGVMNWTCGEYTWEQGGVSLVEDASTRRDLENLQKVYGQKHTLISRSDLLVQPEEVTFPAHFDDKVNGLMSESLSAARPFDESVSGSRMAQKYDLQQDVSRITVDRATDRGLFDFIRGIERFGIYHASYNAVHRYCCRDLTYPRDKLPALAGIASRMHAITGDEYLAGHWRKELATSLFWRVENETTSARLYSPVRIQPYRAPTWSWASIEGFVRWEMVDATFSGNQMESIEILNASVHILGQNAFGEVSAGRITLQATVIEAKRDESNSLGGWRIEAELPHHDDTWISRECPLKFLGPGKTLAGSWIYDDIAMVGLSTVRTATIYERGMTNCTQVCDYTSRGRSGGRPEISWRSVDSAIPQELLLVKGASRSKEVNVLVLAHTGLAENDYRRVGLGRLGGWQDSMGERQVVTLV